MRSAGLRGLRPWALALVVLVSACGGDDGHLFVDLRTDLLPVVEFRVVRTTVTLEGGGTRVVELTVTPADFLAGLRVAELDVPAGTHRITLDLLGAGGVLVISRTVTVRTVSGSNTVTILITRSCRGVVCPQPGDDPDDTECVAGQCVPPDCDDPDSPCADPVCASDDECDPPPAACAEAQCVAGVCLVRAMDGRCGPAERCEPVAGCVPDVPPSEDAGPPGMDAGRRDGGPPPPTCDPASCASDEVCCGLSCTRLHTTRHCSSCSDDCGSERCLQEPGTSNFFCSACIPEDCAAFGAVCCPGAPGMDCTALFNDENNCGMCGRRCPAGQFCATPPGGTPFCTACNPDDCGAFGAVCCPGSPGMDCTALFNDENNCGMCGRRCPAGQFCAAPPSTAPFCTACNPDDCAAFGVICCPGAPGADCTNQTNDPNNCGRCGNRCASGVCVSSTCR